LASLERLGLDAPGLFGWDAYEPLEPRVESPNGVPTCSIALLLAPGDLTLKPGADSPVVDAGLCGALFERRPWFLVGHLQAWKDSQRALRGWSRISVVGAAAHSL
jgi:hypothetical protein